jgi:hypothetical protein
MIAHSPEMREMRSGPSGWAARIFNELLKDTVTAEPDCTYAPAESTDMVRKSKSGETRAQAKVNTSMHPDLPVIARPLALIALIGASVLFGLWTGP